MAKNDNVNMILVRYNVKMASEDSFDKLILEKNHDDFFFLQIGANNGTRYDPICKLVEKLNLSGLAVEPIAEYFKELVAHYDNTKVIPVNYAIFSENTKMSMYKVREDVEVPEWARGIASFNPEFCKKTNIGLEKLIVEEFVDTITFDKLFEDYKVTNIDLLQIDAEGYDYELLKLFPFDRFKPSVVHFEHGLPTQNMSLEQFEEILLILTKNGYNIMLEYYDCIAYK